MEVASNRALHLVGIAGSLRSGSFNRALLETATGCTGPGTTLETLSLAEIPLYDADIEARGLPEPVVALRRSISKADGLVLATPEYNSGIPGVLKNTLDWLSRPPKPQVFDGLPVGILGATPGRFGTRAAQYQLRQNLTPLNALVMPQPMLTVAGASRLFDDRMQLTDEATRERLLHWMEAFEAWTQRWATA